MKKLLTVLLALLLLIGLTACDDEPYDTDDTFDTGDTDIPDENRMTLYDIEGWWSKPASFDGITILYAFSVDPENGIVISYDTYGNVVETYPCWMEDDGFVIDCGELFGQVTYFRDGLYLKDEDGAVHYELAQPFDPDDAPYSMDDLQGKWYKNGEDYQHILIEGDRYSIMIDDMLMEEGPAKISELTSYYNDNNYTGPVLSIEDSMGFSDDWWILDGGMVLYDDFHEEYYLKDSISDADKDRMRDKYAVIRDDWFTSGYYNTTVQFKFTGEVWIYTYNEDDTTTSQVVGRWQIGSDRVYITYIDGSADELLFGAEEIMIPQYSEEPFTRHEGW